MTEKLTVISDLHLAPQSGLSSLDALTQLLKAEVQPNTTLVIAGDGLDLLQLPGRGPLLRLGEAPSLVERCLTGLAATASGRNMLETLGARIRQGCQVVLLPGNHDMELLHPAAEAPVRRALGLGDTDEGLTIHREDGPWRSPIGRWEVVVGHGHRGDGWNNIDIPAFNRALREGQREIALPPGSFLVLKTINAFKPRFPFVDILKPEMPTVALLLLYLDPLLALEHLFPAGANHLHALMRSLRRRLLKGPTLRMALPAAPGPEDIAHAMAEELARGLCRALAQRDILAPEATLDALEGYLRGAMPSAPGTLTSHYGAVRHWLRSYLRAVARETEAFFSPQALGPDDKRIIKDHLPPNGGPRVVVAGHTHAARVSFIDQDRCYINTGTWMDLMRPPALGDDDAVQAWIDGLEAGRAQGLPRLSFARVTPDGPALLEWVQGGTEYRGIPMG